MAGGGGAVGRVWPRRRRGSLLTGAAGTASTGTAEAAAAAGTSEAEVTPATAGRPVLND